MGDDILNFQVGDLVSRISHNHDIIFKISSVNGNTVILQGVNVRLCADAFSNDLVKVNEFLENDDEKIEKLRYLGNKFFPTYEETENEIKRLLDRTEVYELTIEHISGKTTVEK